MVADTAALIEKVATTPVRVVGVSIGSFIAQELMLARPDLVQSAVLMATRGREDPARWRPFGLIRHIRHIQQTPRNDKNPA